MKKLILSTFLILSSFIIKADHNAGGEISWECVQSGVDQGKYIFTLKLYRYCYTIFPLSSNSTLQSNSSLPNITLTLISQKSISPLCFQGSNIDCYITGKGEYGVEMYTYKSTPVTLSGNPPVNGWTFYWSSCCRPDPAIYFGGSITDNLHPQNQSYRIQATMFNTPGQLSGICFDSSPSFAEEPMTVMCTSFKNKYMNTALDSDGDSLSYSFTAPLQNNGNPVGYASHLNTSQIIARSSGGDFIVPNPGFSENVPLPWSHSNMDTLNQAAQIDSSNGEVTFQSYTRGLYAIGVQVESFKNGIKTATIMRDVPLYLLDCDSLYGNTGINAAPTITFNSTKKGIHIDEYRDTVTIGDIVQFNITVRDSQLVDSARLQTISLSAISEHFGTEYSNLTSGCLKPECATLDTNSTAWNGSVWSDSISVSTNFTWNVSCNHLNGSNSNSKTFRFLFKAYDDFCDIPGTNYASAYITVLGDSTLDATMDSITLLSNDSAILNWQQYSGSGFTYYYIYRSLSPIGTFSLIDSISNITTTSYTDTFSSNNSYHYFISLKKVDSPNCLSGVLYQKSILNLSRPAVGQIELNWNKNIYGDNPSNYYKIYRSDLNNQFVFLDSVNNVFQYIDSTLPCLDNVSYYVEAHINGTYFTSSLPKTIQLNNVFNQSTSIQQVITDTSGNVTITWDTLPGLNWNFSAYLIYVASDSTGPFNILDTIHQKNTGSYMHLNAGADTTELFYFIRMKGTPECLSYDTLSQQSNIVSTLNLHIMSLNNGYLQLNWTPFFNKRNKSASGYYRIYKKYGSVDWTLIDSTTYGNEQYRDTVSVCNQNIQYRVEMDSLGITTSVLDYIMISTYNGVLQWVIGKTLVGPIGGQTYTWYLDGSPIVTAGNTNQFEPSSNGNYHLEVELNNGCIVTTNSIDITNIGLDEVKNTPNIEVYPNPHHGKFDVIIDIKAGDIINLELIDVTGKRIIQKSITSSTYKTDRLSFDMVNHPKGLYLLKVIVNNKTSNFKIIYQ